MKPPMPSPMHRHFAALVLLAGTSLAVPAAEALPGAAAAPGVEKVTVRAVARFDFDDARLRAADRGRLLSEVAAMRDVSWQRVTAVGHTDSIGSSAYNQRLAARRAASVRSYLLAQGLDAEMVQAQGRGAAHPVADNADPAGRALNRRTELLFEGVRVAPR
jgi:OOP family OmpA-OmpF porin